MIRRDEIAPSEDSWRDDFDPVLAAQRRQSMFLGMSSPGRPSSTQVTSVLRWMGSKRRSAAEIVSHFPDPSEVRTYFEPFFGGGSVFFAYRPRRAALNDLNFNLVNAWTQIREKPSQVHEAVAAMKSDSSTYYSVRAQEPSELSELEQAIRFVYLNRYCFNGIYRTNRAAQFNVPYGADTGSLPRAQAFDACSAALAGAHLSSDDFARSLEPAGEGDLVYLDPPWLSERATYGEYGYNENIATKMRIKDAAARASERGAVVFVSLPSRHADIVDAFSRTDLTVHYSVASSALRRQRSDEVLIRVASTQSPVGALP